MIQSNLITAIGRFDRALAHDGLWSVANQFGNSFYQPNWLTSVVSDTGPHGVTPMAQSVAEIQDPPGWDGGFNSLSIRNIDPNVTHRISLWFRMKVRTDVTPGSLRDGRLYLGSTLTSDNDPNCLLRSWDGLPDGNPYFYYPKASDLPDGWVLMVGHIHPHTRPNLPEMHPDSGIWMANGTRITSGPALFPAHDYRFKSTAQVVQIRAYQHYSINASGSTVQYCHPRVDRCDGKEPTIAELIAGYGYRLRKRRIDF